jgi:hypothetical protein
MKIESYPPYINDNYDFPYYFVEFTQHSGEDKEHWTLFRRNPIYSEDEWRKIAKDHLFPSRCGHPYNMGGGDMNEYKNAIDMNSREFLEFMVDSLNLRTWDVKKHGGIY